MPIYEYECVDCEDRVERLQKMGDPPPDACEVCGGKMRRLLSAPAFQFKGSGWYVTDYADKKSGSGGNGDSDGGGEGKSDKPGKSGSSGESDGSKQAKSSGGDSDGSSKGSAASSTAGSTSPSDD